MEPFILSCESTVDLPYTYLAARNLPVIPYTYTVNGETYTDDMCRDAEALPRFYRILASGGMPSTSQINVHQYREFLEPLVQQGDVLHLALGSGMTASVINAEQAAKQLRKQYPERKIYVVDTLCSSLGYGLLADAAADRRDDGMPFDAVVSWVLEQRTTVHHQLFTTDLTYFRRSGRIPHLSAHIATVLGICPLMRLDRSGYILAYDKTRGKKNAIAEILREMEEHAVKGKNYDGKCFIAHSDRREDAELLAHRIREKFSQVREVYIGDIGAVIAFHCGPGTVALFFFGDERKE